MTQLQPHEGDAEAGALWGVPPETVESLAAQMLIVDHRDGALRPWDVNDEQRQIWRDIWLYAWVYVLKVRQIGASTAVLFDDVLWTGTNDAKGQRVKCGVFIDTEDKAKELQDRAMDFCRQLGMPARQKGNRLVWPGGSSIHFITAGGRRAGASMTFQRYHLTELPYWRNATNAYNSIMQALVLGGQCIIETTMGVDDPIAKDLWILQNAYRKRFFSFEEHSEYRFVVSSEEDQEEFDRLLTADREEWLRAEGFTRKDAMAYWLWLLENKCANDPVLCFREYPQLPEHAFLYAEGRWCHADPAVADPVRTVAVRGAHGAAFDVYREPGECSHHLCIGVDTAGGLDRDRSAIGVVDGRDGQVVAAFVDANVKIDDLAVVAKSMQDYYVVDDPRNTGRKLIPPLLVETNGVGRGTYDLLTRANAVVWDIKTTKDSAYQGMNAVARAIEAGNLYGPEQLHKEATEVRVSDGRWLGAKDLFMALGFCYNWLRDNPYAPPPIPGGSGFSVQDFMRRHRR